jgi:hypothetical protein
MARAKESLRSGLGRQYLEIAAHYAVPVMWGGTGPDGVSSLLHHGTGFFLECGGPVLFVTAAHVFREFQADKEKYSKVIFQLGPVRFHPEEALIAIDDDYDVVTFRADESVAEKAEKWIYRRSPSQWPPPPPDQGKGVFFGGFPKLYREEPAPDEIDFGLYGALLTATSVREDRITCQLDHDYIEDLLDLGLPPKNAWLGGMSGAPAWTVTETGWRLAGVIYQYSEESELFFIRRPERIRADGVIIPA